MGLDWRDELMRLAAVESPSGSAITFYFQPRTPANRAHREELILIKDLVRDARRELERSGRGTRAEKGLERIQRLGEELQRNGARGKAVFACDEHDLWREFDLPVDFGATALIVNRRFQLKPLAAAVFAAPECHIVLVDRESARILKLSAEGLEEIERIASDVPRRVKTDGFGGYNAGHMERSIDNEVLRHYKHVAERLLGLYNRGDLKRLVVGARPDGNFDEHLHSYLRDRKLGRIDVDPTNADLVAVRTEALRLLEQNRQGEQQALAREIVGESQRNGRGSIGLRRVINSLERGEAQELLIGRNFSAPAVECTNCGHLDTRMVEKCAVCTQPTKEVDDVGDALIGHALRRGVSVQFLDGDAEFERAGNIGALLRFRADQNTAEKKVAG